MKPRPSRGKKKLFRYENVRAAASYARTSVSSTRMFTPGTSANHCVIVLQSSSMALPANGSVGQPAPHVPRTLAHAGRPPASRRGATMPVVALIEYVLR